jgi:hypothetical protein
MGKYYSPNGNFEVWETKPDGYYTEDEWKELHPEPIHIPTKAEKLANLEAEYTSEKNKLTEYFTTALLMDDTETQAELKEELADLEAWYTEEKEKIEGE